MCTYTHHVFSTCAHTGLSSSVCTATHACSWPLSKRAHTSALSSKDTTPACAHPQPPLRISACAREIYPPSACMNTHPEIHSCAHAHTWPPLSLAYIRAHTLAPLCTSAHTWPLSRQHKHTPGPSPGARTPPVPLRVRAHTPTRTHRLPFSKCARTLARCTPAAPFQVCAHLRALSKCARTTASRHQTFSSLSPPGAHAHMHPHPRARSPSPSERAGRTGGRRRREAKARKGAQARCGSRPAAHVTSPRRARHAARRPLAG